jgi:hypothetical protein
MRTYDAGFNPANLGTAFLCSEAAISLDRARLSLEIDYLPVNLLSSQLRTVSRTGMNPNVSLILHQSMQKICDREIRYLDDLEYRVSLLAQEKERN